MSQSRKPVIGLAPALALAFAVPLAAYAQTPTAAKGNPQGTIGRDLPVRAHRGPRADPPGALPPAVTLPNAEAGIAMKYSGAPVDVTTYHYDQGRTGWNPTETDLTATTVASSKFGLLKTLTVDGNVLAQPLLVSNFVMPDKSKHNVLIIATGHNTIYAYDAQSYAILWQVNLGQSQSSTDVGCTDVIPEYGISSTPVIVRNGPGNAVMYVVAATEPTAKNFHSQLHSIDLATGKDTQAPTEIAPSATLANGTTLTFNGQSQWSRTSLGYSNNQIYVGIGSHCDNNSGSISGWMLGYTKKLALKAAFHTIETPASTELASIWMAGFAPAFDASGDIFFSTGNGNYNLHQHGQDYGESVLSLTPSLSRVKTSFTPSNYADLNNSDIDIGSGGVMLIPAVQGQAAPPMAVIMGKYATLYLLNQNDLGGLSANDAGALQSVKLGGDYAGIWGGPAYYSGPAGGTVFFQKNDDALRGYTVNTGATPSLSPSLAGTSEAGYGGSMPIVSSNGSTAGSGIVWLVKRAKTVQLEAYNASTLGNPIFASNAGTWSNPANNAFLTPMEANGRVYVGSTKSVTVFGLTP